eukprot:TRINITY_DN307_c0_g1_i1.p1 TRINITY_DN307_c0_g1~~TRINITY_DN307_c0_g1_i1.p1  ORF type:complete len:239 (+),score=50.96 TRINITY_DN307_c0_g1_i1:232-948(+)
MEAEAPDSKPSASDDRTTERRTDQVRVKKETLQAVLEQCRRALELLQDSSGNDLAEENDSDDSSSQGSGGGDSDTAEELCDFLKSRVESPNFLEKLGSIHLQVPPDVADEGCSWDVINKSDVWEGVLSDGDNDPDKDGYVLVKQEDIMEGIASFMAAYLLSLKETKELSPNQLQEALCKTFSVRKKKGKLRRAWDGSKVIYNVASWSATAIGIYQNPALFRAASAAFWTSCHVISKLL